MNEDYLAYWGMTRPPFSLTPDPDMLYLSAQHAECLMRLKYAVFSHKGGALLVSDSAGNGKTSLLARLQRDLNDYYSGRVKVVFIDHPTLSPIEMIGEIGRQLGTELETTEKIRALNALRDKLYSFYNENIKVIVIVDEGQMLKERPDILGELRILLNFCVSDAFLLTFIFSGQKPLDSILREMPEFWQRLPVRYFLKNLNYNDTKALVQHRLRQVGAETDIFKEEAFDGIYNYSEGCPRVICSIADLCLVVGFAKGVKRIGFVEVTTACRDMESSGDGFHYYAYVNTDQQTASPRPESPPKPSASAPPATPTQSMPSASQSQSAPPPSPALDAANSVLCPACGEPNRKDALFCVACQRPLREKCPRCLAVIETALGTCPVCQADLESARNAMFAEFRDDFKRWDILEGGQRVWLEAHQVSLDEDEQVLIIFPRGNVIAAGPTLTRTDVGSGRAVPTDVILTGTRLLFLLDTGPMLMELDRLESCRVVDSSGSWLGRKSRLAITGPVGKVELVLPYGSRRSRAILQKMALFVQARMVQ